jgi:NAD(P)-dependent dehydrogenase (short-subunit alcohol dehydrogenase family)
LGYGIPYTGIVWQIPQAPALFRRTRRARSKRRENVGILTGKTCVVTGGAGSIGLASASLLVQEGASVTLVDRDAAKLERAAATLSVTASRDAQVGAVADRVAVVCADVSDSEDTRRYLDETVRRWGNIDVLFSHAGISGVLKPVVDYPEEIFDAVMAINVRGSFLACKYGLPLMNKGGSIIITSSIMGVTADPGVVAYATSKHALIGLARVVAKEAAGRGIRVNVLAPGPTENSFQSSIEERLTEVVGRDATEMLDQAIALGRHGRPEEIAQMVLFLASDRSGFSTGSVFMADGGMGI